MALAPKTLDLLVLLVQSPGAVHFSKQELMNALWPDTFVEEANLSFRDLRASQSARRGWGTVGGNPEPKHGYRFGAEVRATMPSAELSAEPVSSAKKRTFLGDAGARHREGVAGAARHHAVLLVVVTFLTGRCASRARRAVRIFARRAAHCGTRDTSGRRASRPTEAGSPSPGTARRWDNYRHLRQAGRSRRTRAA